MHRFSPNQHQNASTHHPEPQDIFITHLERRVAVHERNRCWPGRMATSATACNKQPTEAAVFRRRPDYGVRSPWQLIDQFPLGLNFCVQSRVKPNGVKQPSIGFSAIDRRTSAELRVPPVKVPWQVNFHFPFWVST